MIPVLILGFLLGLQHATEADHLAAVASLVAGRKNLRNILGHGLMWGLGHALALGSFAVLVLLLRGHVPARVADGMETAVGAMLVLLGCSVIYRLARDRIHFHSHRHRDGTVHFHAHSHAADGMPHRNSSHEHSHRPHAMKRSLAVGVMHGLAGSAALVALSAPSGNWLGISMILLFSLGSILGMVALSGIIALPLGLSDRLATGFNNLLQSGIGLVSIAIGVRHMIEHGAVFWQLTLAVVG